MSDLPKNILYIRPDTFGDIILFEPVVRAIGEVWPAAEQTLLVRAGYDELGPLFSPNLRWLTTLINPFADDPRTATDLFDRLISELSVHAPDVIVFATISRTWLELAVAARFPEARTLVLGGQSVDPLFAKSLELAFGIKGMPESGVVVPVIPGETDAASNHRLLETLVGRKIESSFPALRVPDADKKRAASILAKLGLADTPWIAVFPAGIVNVKIKAWDAAKFAEAVDWLRSETKLPILILGHEKEAALVQELASKVGLNDKVWLGKTGEFSLLAGILSHTHLYFGNDTGAMHLAGALDKAIVAIFGGGHWPRFRPATRRAISIVQPLPCFGCGWDCLFGNAPCVRTLTVEDAKKALALALEKGDTAFDEVLSANHFSTDSTQLIDRVVPIHRQLQKDRLERQYKIEELTFLGEEKDVEIDELKAECDVKDVEITSLKNEANTKDGEISSLKNETNFKDTEIQSLKHESNVKDTEIDSLKRETNTKDDEISSLKEETNKKDVEIDSLKREANTKDEEIDSLKGEANTKDAEIDELKETCNERERLIFELSGHIKNFQTMVAELNEAHVNKDKRLTELESVANRVPELTGQIAALEKLKVDDMVLPPQIAQALRDKDVHIQNVEAMVTQREAELAGAHRSLDNHRAGYSNLEQAKYYEKLLHDKEAVIQTLHKACMEREQLIRQLAVEASGLGGRVTKLATAARGHANMKWRQPIAKWFFRKLVEEAEMQIGVLRQHDPRPLKWDDIPKGKLPVSRLPQIGLVTPSYNQDKFIESTMLSVLNQKYPRLLYTVQDGDSKDGSRNIISKYAEQLTAWESVKDKGQADAIRSGFRKIEKEMAEEDIMAWLNSDDLIAPRALRFVGEFFARNPDIDVIYGHRIIIDEFDREVGRWIMPPHDCKTLEWIDYVPQETLFWRKKVWDRVGGVDPMFQFALDWDLLARFQQANARIVRLPYFLGCFRIHSEQKTSQHIHTTGHEEMTQIRKRFHANIDHEEIARFAHKARIGGALTARLLSLGIRR